MITLKGGELLNEQTLVGEGVSAIGSRWSGPGMGLGVGGEFMLFVQSKPGLVRGDFHIKNKIGVLARVHCCEQTP